MYELIFKATTLGDKNFHKYCDNKGPTVVLIKANDHVFGGYSVVNWDSSNSKFNTDNTAFLFSATDQQKYSIKSSSSIYAVYNVNETYILGYGYPDGITLYTNFLSNSNNKGTVGQCYGVSKEFGIASGQNEFKVQELEVFTLLPV